MEERLQEMRDGRGKWEWEGGEEVFTSCHSWCNTWTKARNCTRPTLVGGAFFRYRVVGMRWMSTVFEGGQI